MCEYSETVDKVVYLCKVEKVIKITELCKKLGYSKQHFYSLFHGQRRDKVLELVCKELEIEYKRDNYIETCKIISLHKINNGIKLKELAQKAGVSLYYLYECLNWHGRLEKAKTALKLLEKIKAKKELV